MADVYTYRVAPDRPFQLPAEGTFRYFTHSIDADGSHHGYVKGEMLDIIRNISRSAKVRHPSPGRVPLSSRKTSRPLTRERPVFASEQSVAPQTKVLTREPSTFAREHWMWFLFCALLFFALVFSVLYVSGWLVLRAPVPPPSDDPAAAVDPNVRT